MDKLDLAGALREAIAESRDTQNSVSQTTTTTATALTDSENGRVTVDFGGVTIAGDDDSQGVECDTLVSVRAGDTVTVQLVGATGTARHATVIGVVGRGDEQDARIEDAEKAIVSLEKTSDGLRADVTKKVAVGEGGTVTDLSSVLRMTSEGIDVGAMENGEPTSTHAHIDDDEFSIRSTDGTVLSSLKSNEINLANDLFGVELDEVGFAHLRTAATYGLMMAYTKYAEDSVGSKLLVGQNPESGPLVWASAYTQNACSEIRLEPSSASIKSENGPLSLQYSGGQDVQIGYGTAANLRVNGNIYYSKTHGVVPLYQLYNPNGGQHYFTTDTSERNTLIKAGWQAQGVKCYVFKS